MQKVEICGVDTSKLPQLSAKEMHTLMLKVKAGNEAARERFIMCNLRLVLSVVQRFANRGEHSDDLFQVGCIGLIKAIDNFDMAHEVKFSTYAVPMIIGEIRRHLRDYTPVRVSRSIRDTAYKVMQIKNRLTECNCREPNVDEIARELNVKREEVVLAMDAVSDPLSLFEPIYHDDGDAVYIIDQVCDPSVSQTRWTEDLALGQGLDKLPPREQKILKLRYFLGRTQMEVSHEIGISQAQVSRLEKGALKRLEKYVT